MDWLKNQKNFLSRALFRSTDLWVMGPARFNCPTLLRNVHDLWVTDIKGLFSKFLLRIGYKELKIIIAERGFDPRTSGLWAQHASTAPLCCPCNRKASLKTKRKDMKKKLLKRWDIKISRAWFRSTDLCVMGPARFHSASWCTFLSGN